MTVEEFKKHLIAVATPCAAWVAGRYHFSPEQFAAMTSDIGYGAASAAFVYGAYQRWGTKAVPATAVITAKTIEPNSSGIDKSPLPIIPRAAALFAFLLLGTMIGIPHASAADLSSLKAPAKLSYAQGGCGPFYGINTMGVAGLVNGGPPGATILQGDIGITVGYGCPRGTDPGSFWFAEGDFDFANLNGNANGLGLTGPAHFQQKIAIGGPASALLSVFPNNPFSGLQAAVPALPTCPVNVTCGSQYPFMFFAVHEQDISGQLGLSKNREWLFSPGIGVGLESRWSNGVVVDVTAQWKMDSTAFSLGPQKVTLGNAAIVGLTAKY